MKPVAILTLLALAACGVDGRPIPPKPKTGVTISGEVSTGVVIGG